MRVHWTAPALRDIEKIGEYVAQRSPAAAERLVSRIFGQIDTLIDHPHIGRVGRVDGTRELVISGAPYIAAYRVQDDAVEIAAVLHTSRRWPDKFD
jgi:addiction module RelE/StbE family toxin